MIEGVKIKKLTVHQDIPDRDEDVGKPGFLMEVLRDDDMLLQRFGQSTMTVAYEGTIKAFHYHEHQDDLWFVATGKAMVVLHDLREDSPTKGETQVLFAGKDDYKVIVIPIGVAHGYKVMSQDPVILFYHTTSSYNPANPDEKRLKYDDPKIAFDWSKETAHADT
ncbi:MAG: dTDP-4-dehydrorhamnose 3,5-epimerase family protein [Candidatus Nomurabacteria bacterium]|nr:MAG: dTDP-4-dehydrorhamnose 3,5-epimerase family protein [Candidatus Nomurabacteria bacterium]